MKCTTTAAASSASFAWKNELAAALIARGDTRNNPVLIVTARPTSVPLRVVRVTSSAGQSTNATPISRKLDTSTLPTSRVIPSR